jgi:hypothetical protein
VALTDPPRMYLSFEGCVRAEVIHGGNPFQYMEFKRSRKKPIWRVWVEGEPLARLAALWEALPYYGMDAMCHEPRFGLCLFDAAGDPLAAAAPCFGCNNINIWDADGFHMITFDAASPPGREFLAFLRGLGPGPEPEPDPRGY